MELRISQAENGFDSALEAGQVMDVLAANPFTTPRYNTFVIRSPGSPFGLVAKLYEKAWQQPAIEAWVKEVGIDLATVSVRYGQICASVTKDGNTSTERFTTQSDGWGWEQDQIVDAAGRLDPKGIGLPYPGMTGAPGEKLPRRKSYPYEVVLTFYGYTPPTTQQQATTIAGHIRGNGKDFPLFTMLSGSMGPSDADFRSVQTLWGTATDLQKILAVLDALGGINAGDLPILIPDDLTLPGWISAHPDSPFTHMYKSVSDLVSLNDNISFRDFCRFYGFHDSVSLATLRQLDERLNHAALVPMASQDRELRASYEGRMQAMGNQNNRYKLGQALAEITRDGSVAKGIQGRARHIDLDPSSSFAKTGHESRDDGTVVLADLLAYQDPSSPLPATDAQVNDVLRRLSHDVPAASRLGDYRRLPQREPTAQDWGNMASVMRDFLSGHSLPCLDYLGETIISGKTESELRATPDLLLEKILNSPRSQRLAKKLLGAIGWYGGAGEERTSRSVSEKLLLLALIRYMDSTSTQVGITEGWLRGDHQRTSFTEIRNQFEAHLLSVGKATAASAPLVAHALLASVSPDLLVRDVPAQLAFRSHGWVVFRQGVELAEFLAPGSSRSMGYKQLISLATEPAASKSVSQFMASAAIAPVLEWALANGVLWLDNVGQASSRDIDSAIDTYNAWGGSLQMAITTLHTKFSWKDVAIETLTSCHPVRFRRSDFDDLEGIYLRPKEDPSPRLLDIPVNRRWKGYSILEVYLSGGFKDPSQWVIHSSATGRQKGTWGAFRSGMASVTDIETLKENKVDPYIEDYLGSMGTVISMSFIQCATQDRQFLAYGNLKLYLPKDSAVDKGIALRIEAFYDAKIRSYVIRTKDMAIQSLQDSRSSEHDFKYVSALSTAIFGLPIDAVPSHEDFESRARIIADYILPKDQFRALVIGETALERDIRGENSTRQIVRAVVDVFNPVAWYEDLKSDNTLTRVFGGLGFVGFAGGIFAPAIAGVRGSIAVARAGATLRISMPQIGKLAGKSAVSMIASLNPADGVGTLLQGVWKLGSKAVVGLTGAARSLAQQGAEAFKSLRGVRADDTVALLRNMETDPGVIRVKQIVDGIPNVSVGQNAMGNSYLLDDLSGRLFGPRLAKISHDGRLSSQVHDTIPVLQVGERRVIAHNNAWPGKSWLIDKRTHAMTLMSDGLVVANYRLDDGAVLLRNVDQADGARPTRPLEIAPCRSKRAIDLVPCGTDLRSFQTKDFTTEINFDRKGYMSWFGQERFTPAPQSFAFVREGKIYTGKNGVVKPVAANEIESLGSDISPVYREQISATIMGGSPDFKQIRITEGIDARIPDTREISAFLAEHADTAKPWIVTEADTGKFYFAEVPPNGPVTMKRVDIEEEVLNGSRPPETDEEELAVAMRGALSANAHYRMYPSTVVLEKSLDKLEKLLLENSIPDYRLGRGSRFKYDTTDAQAIMYAARPRVAFNAHIDARLAWPESLPVDSHVLQANSKFYAGALNKLLKKTGAFSPNDFITEQGARSAVQRLREANDGRDSAIAWVRLANGKTEVHYAGFDELNTAQGNGQRWLSAERFAQDPYVDAQGLSLPPLADGSRSAATAGAPSVENRVINSIYHDHCAPGSVEEIKVWVAGTRDPASPFFYQALDNPGVQLRIYDPASNLLMADIEQMHRITPQSWAATDKSTLPAGVESAIDDDLAFAEGVPYVYTWKDGRKSYVVWVPEDTALYSREGEGSTWYVPERYDYQEIGTWRTPEGTEPTVNPFDVASGRKNLDPEQLERVKQGIKDGTFLPPIAISPAGKGKFVIENGHHRLRAAKDLGLQKVPYILKD